MEDVALETVTPEVSELFFNRELSWLQFARRVLAMVKDPNLPLLERMKFIGIMGMLHDEFFMKRIGGLKRQIEKGIEKESPDGLSPMEELMACREEVLNQLTILENCFRDEIRPALAEAGIPLLDYEDVPPEHIEFLNGYFTDSVQPVITPLAVDVAHPFPMISSLGINLAVRLKEEKKGRWRFIRIKVPNNIPRWVELPDNAGFVPLEQVIAANLNLFFEEAQGIKPYFFRVTRGAERDRADVVDLGDPESYIAPGSIVSQVTGELKARRFAGVVRLQVDSAMPEKMQQWMAEQLGITTEDIYVTDTLLGLRDMDGFDPEGHDDLRIKKHQPVTHPRLTALDPGRPAAIFDEVRRGDILLHHPYHSFDTSVLRFIRSAALDEDVLAIKLTIYRTSSSSPIILALQEAARRGKQVAVLVEITARFDEAPNIAWGKLLESEGVHVAYGVEHLKTHVKLALVVREEKGKLKRYAHVSTGNYHAGTARIYEDLGMLTADPEICADAAAVFNELTGAMPSTGYHKLLVAPVTMRERFCDMIQREIDHAAAGRPCGIRAKMNQLQDPDMIRELYRASQAGVPIELNVRGLCCLVPGVPGLSENIRVFGVIGRFLEHSRIYCFENGGEPEYFIGSADWMRRNLNRRVETISPVEDPLLKDQLREILDVYARDNCSVWDCQPDGSYLRREPAEGEKCLRTQQMFIDKAENSNVLPDRQD